VNLEPFRSTQNRQLDKRLIYSVTKLLQENIPGNKGEVEGKVKVRYEDIQILSSGD
jgi:hypothetical protein